MMNAELSILVRAETDSTSIVIEVTGPIRTDNVDSIIRAIERAAQLVGCASIAVDTEHATSAEPEAWAALTAFTTEFQSGPRIDVAGTAPPPPRPGRRR